MVQSMCVLPGNKKDYGHRLPPVCDHLAKLRDVDEVVLVRSCLSSVWLNQKCDMVFRRKDNNYGRPYLRLYDPPILGDAKVVEEPHGFVDSILQRVENHTTAPATEGALIPKPTPKDIIASPFEVIYLKRKRKLKSKASEVGSSTPAAEHGDDAKDVDQGNDLSETDYCVYLEGNLERDKGNSSRAAYFPNLRYSKRLGSPPPRLSNTAPSDPYYAGTSNVSNASSFDHVDTRRGTVPVGVAGKAQAEVMDLLAQSALARDHEYDNIPDNDFSSTILSEEIEITLFPLAHGPYYMPYPFAEGEGSSPPKYTREEWDEPHAPEANILAKEIFKDPSICMLAFDRTVTLAELERTESMSLLHLSNRMDVLTALLVSHGTEMNSRYTSLVTSNARLQDKENKYLLDLNDASSNDVKKLMDQLSEGEAVVTRDMAATEQLFDVLQSEVTHFLSSNFDGLVRGCAWVTLMLSFKKVSKFVLGAQAEFDKAIANIPFTHFPFLAKISEATESTLSEVASIQPDKIARPAVSASVPATSSPTCKTFGWTSTPKASEPTGLAHDASPS
ncbi:hypothetical protein Tco_1244177 [Tanacetum coccineum]